MTDGWFNSCEHGKQIGTASSQQFQSELLGGLLLDAKADPSVRTKEVFNVSITE